jgi:Polyketide cyclase / dehydrase and lipid transport
MHSQPLVVRLRDWAYGRFMESGSEQSAVPGQYTWESGPSDPPRLSDGPGTYVEIAIAASPAQLWPIITDLNMPAKFSAEFRGARWAEGSTGPAIGASFIGSNVHTAIGEWDVPCFVHRCEERREFGWVTSNADNPGAQWCFTLNEDGAVTRLRYSLILGPGPSGLSPAIKKMPEKEPRILSRRLDEHRGNMQLVVEGIKAIAESANSN